MTLRCFVELCERKSLNVSTEKSKMMVLGNEEGSIGLHKWEKGDNWSMLSTWGACGIL